MPSDVSKLEEIKSVLPGITTRKMMGEYLLYKDGVLFGGIYDNRLMLKITRASAGLLADYPAAFPYDGGGEMILCPEPYDVPLIVKAVDGICEDRSRRR